MNCTRSVLWVVAWSVCLLAGASAAYSQDEDVSLSPASAKTFSAPGDVTTLALSPFGTSLAVGFKRGGYALIDIEHSNSSDTVNPVGSTGVRALRFSADGSMLAIAGDDGAVQIATVSPWSVDKRLAASFSSKPDCVDFAPDGASVAVGYDNGKVVDWRLSDSQAVWQFDTGKQKIRVVSINRAGDTLAALSDDGTLNRFDLNSGQSEPTLTVKGYDKAKPDWSKIVSATAAGYGQVMAIGFRNEWITGYGLGAGTVTREIIKIVDVTTGTVQRTLGENLTDVADLLSLSDDGSLAASIGEDRKKVRFWDVRRADILAEPPFTTGVNTIAFGRGSSGLKLAVAAGKQIQVFPISLTSATLPVDTLAVLDLDGSDQQLCKALADIVRAEVSSSGMFVLVTRGNMQEALPKELVGELALSESGLVSKVGKVQLGKLLSAHKLIAGSVSMVGHKYSLTLRLEDVETGRLTEPAPVSCDSEDQLVAASKTLADDLLRMSQ
ncbi:MAG: hypothetical protein ACLQVD_19605 [Capsulimonadaceae bacterium]